MHRAVLVALIATGCWSSKPSEPQPRPPVVKAPKQPVVTTPPCASEQLANAKLQYNCAGLAFDGRDYTTAERLARELREGFPYSKYAMKAEILVADIHAANGDRASAVVLYDKFLHDHPTHEDVGEVRRKRDAADQGR